MTIKCAYHRNCRFLNNDNYKDWQGNMQNEHVRTWMAKCQDFLQMRYYFDTGLGSFETLDGNIPAALLERQAGAPEPAPPTQQLPHATHAQWSQMQAMIQASQWQ